MILRKTVQMVAALSAVMVPCAQGAEPPEDFAAVALPVLRKTCYSCHSTEKQKGDLDLERFRDAASVQREPEIWQAVRDQVMDGAMPPDDAEPLTEAEKNALLRWVGSMLAEAARKHAGDPGPVVLRRLSNAEYTWTLRDLTGLAALDPAAEFPADSAAGEGFTNAGAALSMSPALVSKYLEAARKTAEHAMLLPDGLAFSPQVTARDWTGEKLAAIRGFYGRYCAEAGGTQVNLQGIQFETNGGGRLPLDRYLEACVALRDQAGDPLAVAKLAESAGLSAKYLVYLLEVLRSDDGSPLLRQLRTEFREAKAGDGEALAALVAPWQQALWKFTTVGHIGKRDGPPAWQVPVEPLLPSQEIRVKLPVPDAEGMVTIRLEVNDAGDGSDGDVAVWRNPRLVAPGRAELPLRAISGAMAALERAQREIPETASAYLAAVAGTAPVNVEALRPGLLAAWRRVAGTAAAEPELMKAKVEAAAAGVKLAGWGGADALSVVANPSGETVRIPGTMGPRSLALHPAPQRSAGVAWRAPADGRVAVQWSLQDAHLDCGNGVAWALEHRRASARRRLGSGLTEGGKLVQPESVRDVDVRQGDLLCLLILPRDGDHTCDLTAFSLKVEPSDGSPPWDVVADTVDTLAVANPHPGRGGQEGIWHFFSEPASASGQELPAGSLLSRWLFAEGDSRNELAAAVQSLLAGPLPEGESPDAQLRRQLLAPGGPLVQSFLADAASDSRKSGGISGEGAEGNVDLVVRAPAVTEFRIPAILAEGAELVTTAELHASAGPEGTVQMRVAGDGVSMMPPAAALPVLASAGSPGHRRYAEAMGRFRDLFPAALCYTRIVPVDEVVTLTLFHREDHHLQRLMLSDDEAAELDRLWVELHFVSQDALQSVDAYDQLWQFATQDADPSAFEPLREPIRKRAEEFRAVMKAAEPRHVEWLERFAAQAWRRPLQPGEADRLRGVYAQLRKDELPHEEAVRLVLARILTSPSFLYRAEKAIPGKEPGPVSDRELAVRLSYFLWSSAPDAVLRAEAEAGRLRDPAVLADQTARMLRDPKVHRLAEEFGLQWLHIREIDTLNEKSERHFPTFANVRGAMKEEAARFFTALFQENRPVGDLLDADYTYLNETLARHYGIESVSGHEWRRVDGMRGHRRGGLLGFAAVLAKQSGASRTSPILRGNWLCETLLGERLPRPPKGVPPLPESAPDGLTERAMTERHSSDARCSGCHVRIDPYGFALEGYDAIGRFRRNDAAGLAVSAVATLPDGTAVDGMEGLRSWIAGPRREQFFRQFARKLLGYALGRSAMLSDEPLLEEITAALLSGDGRVGTVVAKITASRQFREARGEDAAAH